MKGPLSVGIVARRKISGFTLIELLVVIAIIAILAAILFPVFAKAREKARQAACMSNEKQVGLAVMQYTQDYDEMMPIASYGNSASALKWMDLVYPYVKVTQAFDCPDAISRALEFVPCDATCSNRTGYRLGTYGLNDAYWNGKSFTGNVPMHNPLNQPLSAILSPAGTILAGEIEFSFSQYKAASIGWDYDVNNPVVVTTTTPRTLQSAGSSIAGLEHNDGMNVLWCDGHTKWSTGDALVTTHTVSGKQVCYLWTIEDD